MSQHQKKALKPSITTFYQEKNLTPDQLHQLQKSIKTESIEQRSANKNLLFFSLSTAACLFIAVLIWPSFFNNEMTIESRIANEVAYNHNKQMSLEINATSLLDISGFLDKLDFSLINSQYLPSEKWKILGGRYCSINGQLAALLKVKNLENNQVYSFYQSLLPNKIKKSKQLIKTFVDGASIQLWQERGLLLGLAGADIEFIQK
jgi:hypothetical protein